MRPALLTLFLVLGALGLVVGAWPLMTGKNFPGWLGNGFNRGSSLRLKRAPALYFRATGAAFTSAGLVNLYVAYLLGLSTTPDVAQQAFAAIFGAFVVVAMFGSLAWMLVLAYRHKLFRWDAP